MSTFQYNGKTYDEADLLPVGDRVNPETIAAGLMKEITVDFNGAERHLPLFTAAGAAQIKAAHDAKANASSEPTAPGTFIIVDDDGMPTGTMDVGQIQDDAMELVFSLAATCGDEDKTEQILADHVTRHDDRGLALVLIAAIKTMTNDILAGAFDVMEATGENPREKMAEIGGIESAPAGVWA